MGVLKLGALFAVALALAWTWSTGELGDSVRNILQGRSQVRRNWEGAVRLDVEQGRAVDFVDAADVETVQRVVREAAAAKRRVRVVGCAHSWGTIAKVERDGVMLSVQRLNRILSVDRASKQITVEGGALLRDIENALEAAGLALPMVPSLDDATIGGVLATGTHGSGTGKAVLSTRVERMRLVSGMGELLQVSRTHNADLFPATLVNLGALGVLVEVTLQAVDWFHVHEIQEPRDATQWLGGTGNDLQRFFEENPDFAKVWLQPLVNQSLFFSGRHTDVARRNNPSVWSTQVRIFGFELLQLLMSYVPSWTPSIMDFLMNKLHVFEALDRVGRPDEVFHVNVRIAQHAECEFSVPLHHCDSFVRAISRHIRLRAPFFNYVLEARPVKGDDIWLSPDYGGTRCHVSVLLYNMGSDSTHRLFRDVEGISARFDGRPHWGKWFYSSAAELSSLFPKWTDWMAARKRLDPHNVFLNPLLERVFGLLHSQTPLPRVRELLGLP